MLAFRMTSRSLIILRFICQIKSLRKVFFCWLLELCSFRILVSPNVWQTENSSLWCGFVVCLSDYPFKRFRKVTDMKQDKKWLMAGRPVLFWHTGDGAPGARAQPRVNTESEPSASVSLVLASGRTKLHYLHHLHQVQCIALFVGKSRTEIWPL